MLLRIAILAICLCTARGAFAADGEGQFVFGSYGRVQPSTDLEGGSGRHTNIVSHGSRIEEGSYVELDFVYDFPNKTDEVDVTVVTTLAFGESLFHETGVFSALEAIRNLFVRAERVIYKPLVIWAGSRMYRGDDIYLLDFWPLDDVNIYGGGAGLHYADTHVDFHFGLNRLETDWQVQRREVPSETFGTETVEWMDRQRIITGLKATHLFLRTNTGFALKAKLFAELQSIGSGTRISEHTINAATGTDIVRYPADVGWSIGAQFGAIGLGKNGFAHLFAKYSGGLAAYGTLSEPFGYDINRKTTSAKEILVALTSNTEFWRMGLMLGSYARYFTDADPNKYDNDDGWEFIIAVRPQLRIYETLALGAEVSHQLKKPNGISPETAREMLPMITKVSFFPAFSFGDSLSLGRPQIRLVYTASFVNADARALFPEGDKRRERSIQHFLGIGAEWWFNTEYR